MSKELSTKKSETALAFPEINALQVADSFNQLVTIMPEHKEMLEVVKESLPEVQRSTSLFYKTQSQFMDNMMTVSHMTPLRNLRQILAQMNNTREAIKESHFKLNDKEIEAKQKQLQISILERKIANRNKPSAATGEPEVVDDEKELDRLEQNQTDELAIQKLENEIRKIVQDADSSRGYISGAIRQLANYTEQYNQIMEAHKLKDWNEEDFEKEEEEYHIKKAFEQALCAARSRHDHSIDEGNMIYLTQIGINGAHAQYEVNQFLAVEQAMLRGRPAMPAQPADPANGIPSREASPAVPPQAPPHSMYIAFLNDMAKHFAGSAKDFAKAKGMSTVSNVALIKKGDERLLLAQKDKEE